MVCTSSGAGTYTASSGAMSVAITYGCVIASRVRRRRCNCANVDGETRFSSWSSSDGPKSTSESGSSAAARGSSGGRFVSAAELRPGDRVEWHRRDAFGSGQIDRHDISEAALAGWLQSDGFVGQYSGTNRSLTIEAMTVSTRVASRLA